MRKTKLSGFWESAVFLPAFFALALTFGGCGASEENSTPAETTVSVKPSNPSHSSSATFEFSCPEGGCTFECRLDTDTWSDCSSPAKYTGLADGSHSFWVRAVSYSGVPDPTPVTYVWTIVTS